MTMPREEDADFPPSSAADGSSEVNHSDSQASCPDDIKVLAGSRAKSLLLPQGAIADASAVS